MSGQPRLDDEQLIAGLIDLGRHVNWPPTGDIAGRVTAAIEAGAARRASRGAWLRRRALPRSILLALVALLILVVVAAAVGLGVPGIRLILGPAPSAGASAVASGPPASATSGSSLPSPTPPGPELGPQVSLPFARQTAGFALLVPTAQGFASPAEVHLNGVPPFARATLVYDDGTTLTEFLGEVQPDAFEKIIGPATTVELVRVSGSDGYWVTGAPHEAFILYRDADGENRLQQVTVTGNVLIWQVGGVALRLQTTRGRDAAIALAESAR